MSLSQDLEWFMLLELDGVQCVTKAEIRNHILKYVAIFLFAVSVRVQQQIHESCQIPGRMQWYRFWFELRLYAK